MGRASFDPINTNHGAFLGQPTSQPFPFPYASRDGKNIGTPAYPKGGGDFRPPQIPPTLHFILLHGGRILTLAISHLDVIDIFNTTPPIQCKNCYHSYMGDYYEVTIGSFGPHLWFSKPIKTICCTRGRNPTFIGAKQEFYIRNLKKRQEAIERLESGRTFTFLNIDNFLSHYGEMQKPCGWFKSKISQNNREDES